MESLSSIVFNPIVDLDKTGTQALTPEAIAGAGDGSVPSVAMSTLTEYPLQETVMALVAGFALFSSIPDEAACRRQELIVS